MEPSCIRRTGLYVSSEPILSHVDEVSGHEICLGGCLLF